MLETQIIELFAHGFRQPRNHLTAFGGKVSALAQQFGIHFLQFTVKPRQFAVALFQAFELAFRVVAERDDLGECRAVFALERVDEIEPFLKPLKLRGVNVHFFGVMRKPGL